MVWALAVPMLFVACDDDDNPGGGGDDDQNFRAESGVYVFNQGNQSAGIGGALSFIDPSTASYRNDVFLLVNGRELGSMLQDGVVLGDNLYIAVNGSNTVEVVNKNTVQSVAQIPTPSDLGGPRDVVTDGEYVYASMYGGYVVRIDPATNEIDNTVQVGPNPEEMAVLGNHLYVVNSDGMNWPPADCSVSKINLDDFTHIDFLEKTIGYIPETISCRFNPGGIFQISNDIMDNPGDAKYGMTEEQLFDAYRILREKGAKHFGLHAFLASNTVTNEYYPMLAKVLFELAVRLKKETGADIRFINLSGGIGIPYRPDQEANDIRIIGEGVRRVYEEVLVPAGMGDVAIYTELGRFMMGPYGCLVTKAIHEKHTYKEYIGVDACAVNLMRPAMYGAYHHITVMGKEDAPCDHVYDVTGSLCENNDKFAIDRPLPKIDKGDLLVIHDTGAHGYAMGYNYNGKLKSAELLLKEDGGVQLIRRAETPKDYFATFDCFDIIKGLV